MGRDKLTFLLPEKLAPFGLWIEQLVAESTGKEGKGLVPIINEPRIEAGAYSNDRVFICVDYKVTPDHAAWRGVFHKGVGGD